MTRQEELREGITKLVADTALDNQWHLVEQIKDYDYKRADQILSYLYSQGVVIKVDRELPEIPFLPRIRQLEFGQIIQQDMLKAVFVAVEPLIEGG